MWVAARSRRVLVADLDPRLTVLCTALKGRCPDTCTSMFRWESPDTERLGHVPEALQNQESDAQLTEPPGARHQALLVALLLWALSWMQQVVG